MDPYDSSQTGVCAFVCLWVCEFVALLQFYNGLPFICHATPKPVAKLYFSEEVFHVTLSQSDKAHIHHILTSQGYAMHQRRVYLSFELQKLRTLRICLKQFIYALGCTFTLYLSHILDCL